MSPRNLLSMNRSEIASLRAVSVAVATLLFLIVVGCAGAPRALTTDLVQANTVRIDLVASELVVLSPPTVLLNDDTLTVAGRVTRRAGVDAAVDGHVALIIVRPDGTEEEEIPLSLIPRPIPLANSGQSEYRMQYGWIPPRGTVFRLLFDDQEHVASGNSGAASNAGGRPADLPSGPNTPSAGGAPKSGARKTPGTPKQGRSAPRTPGVGSGGRGHR